MSRLKCASLSLVVILVGCLSLAAPDGLCSSCQDPISYLDVGPAPLPEKPTELFSEPKIELVSANRAACPNCQGAVAKTGREDSQLQKALTELYPDAKLRVVTAPDRTVAIAGEVQCSECVGPILELAHNFCPTVVNCIQVIGPQQVRLHVLIAEVERGKLNGTRFEFSHDSNLSSEKLDDAGELRGFLHALEEEGSAKIIAEPMLVTCSGRAASMAIGGEFPIIVPGQQGTFSVEFREYGTRLECVPVVLGHGRVRLQVRPVLTSLDYANGVALKGTVIPGVRQRSIETAAELVSGETLVVGGLYSTSDSSDAPHCKHPGTAAASESGISAHPNEFQVESSFVGELQFLATDAASDVFKPTETELIIMVRVDLFEPMNSGSSGHASGIDEVMQASNETDADHPHTPAVLLTPADAEPLSGDSDDKPRARISGVRGEEAEPGPIRFRLEIETDSGVLGRAIGCEANKFPGGCNSKCSDDSECGLKYGSGCCRLSKVGKADSDECDDSDECNSEEAVESFVEHVLQARMQYLEAMVQARLQHEFQLLQVKASADAALAKQQVEHAEEVMEIESRHLAEIHKMKEAIWESERKWTELQHRQALEHERELAELRRKNLEDLHAQQLASAQSELRALRERIVANESERAGNAGIVPSTVTLGPAIHGRATNPAELTIQVEDLTSGRVRYGTVKSSVAGISDTVPKSKPSDVELTDFTAAGSSTYTRQQSEIDRLRREVARLRALVEDLLCIAEEAPPSPVPQTSVDSSDN